MAFTRMTTSVENVTALPNLVTGQSATLKGIFDKAGVDLKAYDNALCGQLEASTAAGNIGALNGTTATTIQAILTIFKAAIADRYTKTETNTKVSTETNDLVADVDVNLTTGVITVTKKDGTVETYDTALEKVPATFKIIEVDGVYYLKITNVDGSTSQTDITNLMNIYTFNNTDEVAFSTSGEGNEKTVTATIRANSIGLDKLSLSVVSTIEGYANNASASASSASASATNASASATSASESQISANASASTAITKASEASASASTASMQATLAEAAQLLSKSWAIGQGDPLRTDQATNNAKYWSQQAEYIVGSISTDLTVSTTDWVSDSTYTDYGYKATKSVNGVTATNNIVVGIAENATSAQENASLDAEVKCKGQANGQIYLYAKSLPSTDLPITVLLCGGSHNDDIPTKTSDLQNDSGFIDKNVDDLTNYVKNNQLAVHGGDPGLVKLNNGYGIRVVANNQIGINPASNSQILAKTTSFFPITPYTLDYSILRGLAYNTLTWEETEKQSAREIIGAQKNITSIKRVTNFRNGILNVLGDSQTQDNTLKTKPYHAWLQELLELSSVNNYGVSGSTIGYNASRAPMVTRYTNMADDADMVIVMGGINDCCNASAGGTTSNVPLGTITDTANTTFYGALKILCDGLLTKYSQKQILFVTPTEVSADYYQGGIRDRVPSGVTVQQYAQAMVEVCAMYSIPVFDAFSHLGFSAKNTAQKNIYFVEGLHLNDAGHEVLGKALYNYILNIPRTMSSYEAV